MPYFLLALNKGSNIPVDRPILLVGRSNDCDVVLRSKKVSRKHSLVVFFNDRLIVRDLGSTNGTFVNGVRVVQAELQANDLLQIGDYMYQLVYKTTEMPRGAANLPSVPPVNTSNTS